MWFLLAQLLSQSSPSGLRQFFGLRQKFDRLQHLLVGLNGAPVPVTFSKRRDKQLLLDASPDGLQVFLNILFGVDDLLPIQKPAELLQYRLVYLEVPIDRPVTGQVKRGKAKERPFSHF